MKAKVLIASLALAAGAGSAHATIATGSGAQGELFLSVWDQAAQQSYSQDLGIDLAQFLLNTTPGNAFNSNVAWSVALNPVWGSFFNSANAGATVYNVAATKQTGLSSRSQTYGYLTSFNTANPLPVIDGNIAQVQGVDGVIQTKAALYNGADEVNIAQNDAKIWSSASDSYYNTLWGNDFNFSVPSSQNNQGVYGGTTLALFHGLDPVTSGVDRWVTLGSFQLTPTALTYTPGGAPVPVPAAFWLFGSALAGLLGFSRRANRA